MFKTKICVLSKCSICFCHFISSNETLNFQKFQDVCGKYLHSSITKSLVRNKEKSSLIICSKCASSAVQLVHLSENLDFLQKSVTELSLLFSLEILHRRRRSKIDNTENLENHGLEKTVIEFDVSDFPDGHFWDHDANASRTSAGPSSPVEARETCSKEDHLIILNSDQDLVVDIKTENIWNDFEDQDEPDYDDDFDDTADSTENGTFMVKSEVSHPLISTERSADETKRRYNAIDSPLPVVKLNRLNLDKLKISVAEESAKEHKRIRRKKMFPEEENYTLNFGKRKYQRRSPNSEGLGSEIPLPRRKVGRPKKLALVDYQLMKCIGRKAKPVSETVIPSYSKYQSNTKKKEFVEGSQILNSFSKYTYQHLGPIRTLERIGKVGRPKKAIVKMHSLRGRPKRGFTINDRKIIRPPKIVATKALYAGRKTGDMSADAGQWIPKLGRSEMKLPDYETNIETHGKKLAAKEFNSADASQDRDFFPKISLHGRKLQKPKKLANDTEHGLVSVADSRLVDSHQQIRKRGRPKKEVSMNEHGQPPNLFTANSLNVILNKFPCVQSPRVFEKSKGELLVARRKVGRPRKRSTTPNNAKGNSKNVEEETEQSPASIGASANEMPTTPLSCRLSRAGLTTWQITNNSDLGKVENAYKRRTVGRPRKHKDLGVLMDKTTVRQMKTKEVVEGTTSDFHFSVISSKNENTKYNVPKEPKCNLNEEEPCDTLIRQKGDRVALTRQWEMKHKDQYKCDICGKGFCRPSALTIHRRMHTVEKPSNV